MVSYKSYFYILTIMFTLLNNQFIKSEDMSELQARKYISHLVDHLFIPQNHQAKHQAHLRTFTQEATNDLTTKLGDYPHWYSLSKVYNQHQIYQEVINESLAFIEKCARNCAINEAQRYYTETHANQKAFVDKVVDLLMHELKAKINKSSTIVEGLLTGYYGIVLETKIQSLVDKELKSAAARLEKAYAKTHCFQCALKFNAKKNKKIALSCKHTICLACLKMLWNKMGSCISCPKCYTKINLSEYIQGVWVTPSSTYDYHYSHTGYTGTESSYTGYTASNSSYYTQSY